MVLIRQFPVPTEGIKLHTTDVEAYVDNDIHGKGNLFVTEANIVWINNDTAEGFKVAYKKMTLHAISRDPGVHSRACLYIMVNGNVLDEDEHFEVEAAVESDEGEGEELTEIRFVPDDGSVLDDMYKAVQECSLLHPDPSSDLSNDDEEQDQADPEEDAPEGNEDEEQEGLEEEVMDEEDEEAAEAERLEQFIRMQLLLQNRRNDDQNGGGDGDSNGGGKFQLSFVPQPGQFDDAD